MAWLAAGCCDQSVWRLGLPMLQSASKRIHVELENLCIKKKKKLCFLSSPFKARETKTKVNGD